MNSHMPIALYGNHQLQQNIDGIEFFENLSLTGKIIMGAIGMGIGIYAFWTYKPRIVRAKNKAKKAYKIARNAYRDWHDDDWEE